MRPRPFACAIALTLAAIPAPVLAERIAPLHAIGAAADGDRASIDRALRVALGDLGHTTPTDAEVLQGEGAAGASIAKSAGLVAVGKTTGAAWVVQATLTPPVTPGARPRVELSACAVDSGRVESLARDLDPKADLVAPLREMLALLLRPQGVGDEPLPWETNEPGKTKGSTASAGAMIGEPASLPPRRFGAEAPWSVGLGVGAFDLAHRPAGASGGRGVGAWSAVAAVTVTSRGPIVDVLARVGGLFGPGPAFRGELGARVLAPLGAAVAIGGAASVGVFAGTANAKVVRPLVGVDAVLALAPSPRWQLDLDLLGLRVAPGSDGALVFLGAEATLAVRF